MRGMNGQGQNVRCENRHRKQDLLLWPSRSDQGAICKRMSDKNRQWRGQLLGKSLAIVLPRDLNGGNPRG